MERLKIISLDESNERDCEELRSHPKNLMKGELPQIRLQGFFRYYDFISDEHYHWGVSDGELLVGMVSLAVIRSEIHTVVLMTDFFSRPENRYRLSSRKLIERVHEFLETLRGPVVLLAIESRYRLLDPLLVIAERFGFEFSATQILQSVAIPSAMVGRSPIETERWGCKLSELEEVGRESLSNFLKADLSWPPDKELLRRVVAIDPNAQLISANKNLDSSWAILYSESAYRVYEGHTHINVIASDDRLISAAARWAEQQGFDWLLMREPFPRLSADLWPGHIKFSNRVLVGFRKVDLNIFETIGAIRFFQGLTV